MILVVGLLAARCGSDDSVSLASGDAKTKDTDAGGWGDVKPVGDGGDAALADFAIDSMPPPEEGEFLWPCTDNSEC